MRNATVWNGIGESTVPISGTVQIIAYKKSKLGTPDTEVIIKPRHDIPLADLIVQ